VGVLVPWNATNEEHLLSIHIETEDGTRLEPQFPVKLNVGRPPQSLPGQQFRTMIAIQGSWRLPGPGSYRVVASLQSTVAKTVSFRAIAATTR
jgi:hypothetical protein